MWRNLDKSRPDSVHYSVMSLSQAREGGMEALRAMFPEAKADDLNACVFSTSGVHGTYTTIEEIEEWLNGKVEEEEYSGSLTFLVIHPRLVALRYGVCYPKDQADIDFLKALRSSSHAALASIGGPYPFVANQTQGD